LVVGLFHNFASTAECYIKPGNEQDLCIFTDPEEKISHLFLCPDVYLEAPRKASNHGTRSSEQDLN